MATRSKSIRGKKKRDVGAHVAGKYAVKLLIMALNNMLESYLMVFER